MFQTHRTKLFHWKVLWMTFFTYIRRLAFLFFSKQHFCPRYIFSVRLSWDNGQLELQFMFKRMSIRGCIASLQADFLFFSSKLFIFFLFSWLNCYVLDNALKLAVRTAVMEGFKICCKNGFFRQCNGYPYTNDNFRSTSFVCVFGKQYKSKLFWHPVDLPQK